MAEFKGTRVQLGKGFKLPIGASQRVQLSGPPVPRVRLVGMFFDLKKAFLLPSAIPGLKEIKKQYDAHPASNLLVVGHTDTSGQDDYNLPLSLERAEATGAYLKDDVAAWEKFFKHQDEGKRWGVREIQFMLSELPQAGTRFYPARPSGFSDGKTVSGLRRFQGENGLKQTGEADDPTRKALITAYMSIDGTSLPANVTLTTHGCGEHFPADAAPDNVRSPEDRRVEMFLFDGPIDPPAPPTRLSKRGSTEYARWLASVTATFDFEPLDPAIGPIIAARLASQFSFAKTFPKPSAIAILKTIHAKMDGDPSLTLLLVGHTDKEGEPATNNPLSLSRAKSVKAWLTHDAAYFRERFKTKDPVATWFWAEIQWMLLSMEFSGTPCYVGQVDGFNGPATHRGLEYFQVREDLEVNGLADETTLTLLIRRYLESIGDPIPPERIEIAGAGEDHLPLPFGTATDLGPTFPDKAPQRFRRVEAFLFSGPVQPPAATLAKDSKAYRTWCRQTTEDITDTSQLITVVAVVDEDRKPLPGLLVELFSHKADSDPLALGPQTTDDLGLLRLSLEEGLFGLRASLGDQALQGGFHVGADEFGAQMVALSGRTAAI